MLVRDFSFFFAFVLYCIPFPPCMIYIAAVPMCSFACSSYDSPPLSMLSITYNWLWQMTYKSRHRTFTTKAWKHCKAISVCGPNILSIEYGLSVMFYTMVTRFVGNYCANIHTGIDNSMVNWVTVIALYLFTS